MAESLQRVAFEFQERIIEAAHGPKIGEALQEADTALSKLRVYMRLCVDLKLLSAGQYAHVGKMVDEIGRLLGGWRKSVSVS